MTIDASPKPPYSGAPDSVQARTPYGIAGLLAAIWVISAMVRPEATFHLGPVVLPLVPLIITSRSANPVGPIVFGIGLGALVIALLSATGRLAGPALEPFSSATAESVALLIGAGVVGLLFARLAR